MITRIARFPGQPDRFTEGHAYRYVIDTLRDTEGCVSAFHLAGPDESVSISVWVDEPSMRAGEERLAAVRDGMAIASSPPPDVVVYEVAAHT